jgi:N-acetylglucosaminyl-diphospho-decaprenol L-rhamnosyltransferase
VGRGAAVSADAEVAVVFVSYGSEALVAPRAEALLAAGLPVIVADNSGTYDGPGQVVDPGGNVGFGGGCNAAVAMLPASCQVAILHNPDVDADPSVLRALAARLAADDRGGLLAPAVREPGGVRPTGFRWPTAAREVVLAVLEATGWQRRRRHRAAPGAVVPAAPAGATFGTGALLAVHLPAFRAVGGFDERFFLYLEDADLWRRVDDAGWTVGFAPDLVVDHASASGSALGDLDRAVLRWVGVELFAALHHGARWRAFRLAHLGPMVSAALRGSRPARTVLGAWLRGRSPEAVAAAVSPRERAAGR